MINQDCDLKAGLRSGPDGMLVLWLKGRVTNARPCKGKDGGFSHLLKVDPNCEPSLPQRISSRFASGLGRPYYVARHRKIFLPFSSNTNTKFGSHDFGLRYRNFRTRKCVPNLVRKHFGTVKNMEKIPHPRQIVQETHAPQGQMSKNPKRAIRWNFSRSSKHGRLQRA